MSIFLNMNGDRTSIANSNNMSSYTTAQDDNMFYTLDQSETKDLELIPLTEKAKSHILLFNSDFMGLYQDMGVSKIKISFGILPYIFPRTKNQNFSR